MRRSVLVIAHNEEALIGKCIQSILSQTIRADEIVVIAHNCTDKTIEIAKAYPVTTIEFREGFENSFARIKGLEVVTGDIIFCIDGDSYAKENWIAELEKTLLRNPHNVLAGSFVKIGGTLFWDIFSWIDKFLCVLDPNKAAWIWGASFALKAEYKNEAMSYLKESGEVSKKLGLTHTVNDFWLALQMQKHGSLVTTNTTHVCAIAKEATSCDSFRRQNGDVQNGKKMYRYWQERNKV
jgi:glycosyltransferase involved in cell wall biosynthesis